MYPRIFIVTVLFHILKLSEQRNIEKVELDHRQIEELKNLIQRLDVQIQKEHKVHHKSSSNPKDNLILGEKDALSLFLNQDDDSKGSDRSDEGVLKSNLERDCRYGRCGCSGTRCGNNRADDASDEVANLLDSLERTINKDIQHKDHTRCGSNGRCSKNKNDRDDLDDHDDSPNVRTSDDIKNKLERYGKKIKLNKQLDAIVLDSANVNDALNELNRHCKHANCKLIDYSKRESNEVSRNSGINAVVLDLTHLPDGGDEAKELNNVLIKNVKLDSSPKDYLTPDDLDNYYQQYKKRLISDVVNYLKGKSGRKESVKLLSGKQEQLIENVKYVLVEGGIGLNDKRVVKEIENILFGKHSPIKILPHTENNNNIYVPKDIYDRMEKSKSSSYLRAKKRLLPLTLNQRIKLQKKPMHLLSRKFGPTLESYGMPFDLQVQGLGQVVN